MCVFARNTPRLSLFSRRMCARARMCVYVFVCVFLC